MIKQKTFKFNLHKPNDLSNNPEAFCNIIQCGKHKFTIKNFMNVNGHDDSLPYQGDLYCNNVFICHCFNSGWGGQTELTVDGDTELGRMQELDKDITRYKWQYGSYQFDLHLDFIADTLACSEDWRINH